MERRFGATTFKLAAIAAACSFASAVPTAAAFLGQPFFNYNFGEGWFCWIRFGALQAGKRSLVRGHLIRCCRSM